MLGTKNVVCFGEVLWDVLPAGRNLGGAPLNVAYHLHLLGVHSTVISRIGNDTQGSELRRLLVALGLDAGFIQTDEHHQTSEVRATIAADDEVTYEIISPVAWDFIAYEKQFDAMIERAEMLVFGSLAARNETSRRTLYQLIEKAKFKFFDVNLRDPHYTKELVIDLLMHADAVKLNVNELRIIAGWLGGDGASERDGIRLIQEEIGNKELIVTKGAQGASYYWAGERYDQPAYATRVNDTIGSGDAFLAAFISKKLQAEDTIHALDFATALGAFVASFKGGTPVYRLADLTDFVQRANSPTNIKT